MYLNQILRPIVGQWVEDGDDFVLLEDNDSGHAPSGYGVVGAWKRENIPGRFIFNAPYSPDINIAENAWRVPDHYVRVHSLTAETADDLELLACEGWVQLKQSSINRWVDSMPRRLQYILQNGGKMVAYEGDRRRPERVRLPAYVEIQDSEDEAANEDTEGEDWDQMEL